MKRVLWLGIGFVVAVSVLSGCGRWRPGGTFEGEQWNRPTVEPSASPIPVPPWYVTGPEGARVRVVAFFPMDAPHEPILLTLKALAKQYPGKVYVKMMDVRSPEGEQAAARAQVGAYGLLINGESTVTINAKPNPYQVEFNQDPGRFWTLDDLKAAVVQAVAKEYGR